MSSPAKRHLDKFYAAQKRRVEEDLRPETTAYQMQLFKLKQDKARLKQIQSREHKIELKKTLIPEYNAWIDGVLESDLGQEDEVFLTLLIWHLDIGDFKTAYPMTEYAMKHQLTLPDQYKRKLETLIAEEVANTALLMIKKGEAVDFNVLNDYLTLLKDSDMPDEVRAKLCKACGLSSRNKEQAIALLSRAMELDQKSGVKKIIEQLERELKKESA